jgi:hypothetical protein
MNAVRSAHSRVIAAAAPTWLPFGSRSFRWRALSLTQRVDTDARRLTKLKTRSAGQRTGTYEKNAIFSAWVMRRIGASGSAAGAAGSAMTPLAINAAPSEGAGA